MFLRLLMFIKHADYTNELYDIESSLHVESFQVALSCNHFNLLDSAVPFLSIQTLFGIASLLHHIKFSQNPIYLD